MSKNLSFPSVVLCYLECWWMLRLTASAPNRRASSKVAMRLADRRPLSWHAAYNFE